MSREVMKRIKTWSERCEEHPDHQTGMISERMIQERMQEEIDELRQALETEQEPVAWRYALDASVEGPRWIYIDKDPHQWLQGPAMVNAAIEELHTSPQPSKPWVGLTDEELKPLCDENHIMFGAYTVDFIQAIEAKLKEKNHG